MKKMKWTSCENIVSKLQIEVPHHMETHLPVLVLNYAAVKWQPQKPKAQKKELSFIFRLYQKMSNNMGLQEP